ncbi:MAG TPA: DUF1622 domain-containing protein [Candidatus Angelobacter sp.]
MEEMFKTFAGYVALGVEAAAALLIVIGAAEALFTMLSRFVTRQVSPGIRKETWGKFGVWLLLGLEFELAADIVRTAIAPSWNDIGQLAAIAGIRTFLNYFLEKDIEKYGEAAAARTEAPVKRAA